MDHDSTERHQRGRRDRNRIRQGSEDRIYGFNGRRRNHSDHKEAGNDHGKQCGEVL